jgi:hypothetical protein
MEGLRLPVVKGYRHHFGQMMMKQNNMFWTHFKNEQKQNSKEGFEHKSKRKMLKKHTTINVDKR